MSECHLASMQKHTTTSFRWLKYWNSHEMQQFALWSIMNVNFFAWLYHEHQHVVDVRLQMYMRWRSCTNSTYKHLYAPRSTACWRSSRILNTECKCIFIRSFKWVQITVISISLDTWRCRCRVGVNILLYSNMVQEQMPMMLNNEAHWPIR